MGYTFAALDLRSMTHRQALARAKTPAETPLNIGATSCAKRPRSIGSGCSLSQANSSRRCLRRVSPRFRLASGVQARMIRPTREPAHSLRTRGGELFVDLSQHLVSAV